MTIKEDLKKSEFPLAYTGTIMASTVSVDEK